MSEDKKELELPNQTTCFTLKETAEIEAYKEAGLPGIIEVTDEKLMAAFEMCLDGIRFTEVARSLKLKKVQVMYLAEKYNWHQRRQEFLDELDIFIKDRVVEEKLKSKTFLMKSMHVFRKRISKKMDKYLSTDDESIGDTIDFKEISIYNKMVETLMELDGKGVGRDQDGKSLIGINPGDGVTITKTSDNTVEITPRQKTHAQMLADLANSKREQKKDIKN